MSAGKAILVLGAGELGMEVLLALAAKNSGSKITVMMRSESIAHPSASKSRRLETLRSKGVDIIGGDIVTATKAELAILFQPFHTIIGCTGFVGGLGTQVKIARAILAARTPRYFPWQFGVDYDAIGRGSTQSLFDENLNVRDLLRAQTTTEWVIVSTGIFMSFMFASVWGMVDVENETVRAFGSWDHQITATTAEDIGRLTAEIVFTEPSIQNEIVYIAGDTVNYTKLAEIVDRIHGKTFKRELWSSAQLKQEYHEDPGNALKQYRPVWAEGKGVAWDVHSTFNGKKGIKTTGMEQWGKEHLEEGVVGQEQA